MATEVQPTTSHVLLVDPTAAYKHRLEKVLNVEAAVVVEAIEQVNDFRVHLHSRRWDAVIVLYTICSEPIRIMEADDWETTFLILCDTQAEADQAYDLTSLRINDVVMQTQLKRIQLILRRETRWRIARADATAIALQKGIYESLQSSENRFRSVIEGFNDPILFIDNYQIIRYANKSFASTFNYPSSQVLGKPIQQFIEPIEAASMQKQLRDILQLPNTIQNFETRLRRADNGWEIADVTAHSMSDPRGQPTLILHIHIITTRKKAEEHIGRLNRTLSVLSDINQAIVRIRDLPTLYKTACDIAVEKGAFKVAWIGLVDWKARRINPVGYAGMPEDLIPRLTIDIDNPQLQGAPSISTLQTMKRFIVNDIETDLLKPEWRETARRMGFGSSAALPLLVNGEVRGIFHLFTPEVSFFNDDEIRLVDEMAGDIAFAMAYSEQESHRQQAEAALLESEGRYHQMLDDLLEGCQILSPEWRYLYVNEVNARLARMPRNELLGAKMTEKFPGIEQMPFFAYLERSMRERIIQRAETEFFYPDGTSSWFELSIQPVPEGILILTLDITERKRSEVALKNYAYRMEMLHEIDTRLIAGGSVQELAENALINLRRLIPYERGDITVIDTETNTATVFAVNSENQTTLGHGLKVAITPNVVSRYNANHTLIVDDIRPLQDARPHTKALIDEGLLSWLSVLLMDGERPIGTLSLFATKLAFFKAEDAEIAAEVGNQIAIAIRQLRLSTELSRRALELADKVNALEKAESVLKRYARRMEVLHEIDNGIISATSVEKVVDVAVKKLREIIPCQRIDVTVIDEVTNEAIVFVVGVDGDTALGQGTGYSIPPHVYDGFDERHVQLFNDIRLVQETRPRAKQLLAEGLLSGLSVLLMDRDRPIGALGLFANTTDYFSAEDTEIAAEVASQLAIAIRQLQMSDALHQSEERYREVIENQTDLICRYRPDHTLTFVNRAYSDLVQMPPEVLIGKRFDEVFPPVDIDITLNYLNQLTPSNPVGSSEHRSRLPDGSIRWVQWKDRALFDNAGKIIEYQTVGRDVTDRKNIQAERDKYTARIEELSSFLQSALDAFPANTVVLDTTGTIISMNNPWMQFARANNGDTTTYYAGANYIEVCEKAVGYDAKDARITGEGILAVIEGKQDEFYLEYTCHSPSEQRWFAVRVTPFLEPAPRRVVVAHSNITERKVNEQELSSLYNATSYLFKADSLLNLGQQIVAAVVHEFQHADCGLMLYDKKQKKIVRLARTGEFDIRPESPLLIDGPGLVPLALRTGKTVYVPNVANDPHYIPSEVRTRSEIVIPLKTINGVIGVLDLQSDEVNAFSERDQRILLAYVERAAPAIENRQLYEEINQHAAVLEWRVAQRTAEVIYSKNRVEAILNNSADGILLAYSNTGIQQSNTMFNTLFACSEDDYFGKPLSDLVRPEDREQLTAAIEDVLKSKQGDNIEMMARRKDGTAFDAEFGLGYIRTEENREQGIVCVIRDITKRKQAEQVLQSKVEAELAFQKYLRQLHEISIELTSIDDLDVFYRKVVELGLERLGFDRMALFLYDPQTGMAQGTFGTDIHGQITDERDVIVLAKDFNTLMLSLEGQDRFSFEDNVTLYSRGEPVGNGWQASAALWDGKQSTGWLVTDNYLHQREASKPLLDALALYAMSIGSLLARKQTEAAQRESEEKFRMLIDAAPIAAVITNHVGQIILINERSIGLFGYKPDEITGQLVDVLVPEHARDRHAGHRDAYLRVPRVRRMGQGLELFARHKNGSEFPVEIELSYINMQSGLLVIAFIVDITEHKQAQETLIQAYEKERELGELKSRFVSMASHEFRTPLANILAMTETLSSYRKKMTDEQISDRLGSIRGQVDRLKGIMDDVLQLARIQAKRVEFNPLDLSLDDFCREVITEYQLRSELNNRIVYHCPVEPPPAKLDRKLMRHILDNLLSNALKYSGDTKPVEIELTYAANTLNLSIKDHGIGIPEPDLKHLFEPFHRAANVGTISGTGLGLVITKEAVELHGGSIHVTSVVGEGTTMTVSIPLLT